MVMFNVLFLPLFVTLPVLVRAEWPDQSCHPCRCSLRNNTFLNNVVKYANCANLDLEHVPDDLPNDLQYLDLSNNDLQSKGIQKVCMYLSLKVLSLANNSFILINSPFQLCSRVVQLDVSNNLLRYVSAINFQGLVNLENILGLEVEGTEQEVFKHLKNLKSLQLTLSSNAISIKIFSGSLLETLNLTLIEVEELEPILEFGIKSLKIVEINGPQIKHISKYFLKNLLTLEKISLWLPKITDLPENLFVNFGSVIDYKQTRNLQEINLKSMNTLPVNIFIDLTTLKRLEIHNVPKITIEGLFDSLVNLEMLNLTGSNIVKIPEKWFHHLGMLKSLNMSNTTLRSLSDNSFSGLVNVQDLDLSLNALRMVSRETLDPMRSSIRRLILRGNILKQVNDDFLSKMSHLQYIDMSDNKINRVSVDAFIDLRLLKTLKMQENMLVYLPKDVFRHQTLLSYLDLSSNTFNRIPMSINLAVTSIRFLMLANNKIRLMPPNLNTTMPYLKYLSLRDNPINCQCRILSLRLYRPRLFIDTYCKLPREFYNQHVMWVDVPDTCPGPRPLPGEKPSFPELLMPSVLPAESEEKLNYYYYYVYGTDYYDYETDMYYDVDSKTNDCDPEKTAICSSSTIEVSYQSATMASLRTDDLMENDAIQDTTETSTGLKGSYKKPIGLNQLTGTTEPLENSLIVRKNGVLDTTPIYIEKGYFASPVDPTPKTIVPYPSIGADMNSMDFILRKIAAVKALAKENINCTTEGNSTKCNEAGTVDLSNVASVKVGGSTLSEDNIEQLEVPRETKLAMGNMTDSIFKKSIIGVLCGVALLMGVVAASYWWRRKMTGQQEYQVNIRNPVSIGV